MKNISRFFGIVLCALIVLPGCLKSTSPNIAVQERKEGVLQQAAAAPASPSVAIVTAEPATKAEPDAQTESEAAKDKPGAVALKVEY